MDGAAPGSTEQGEVSGEHRVVTMLFCDVRGSTAMAEELDAEAWTDVMNEAYEHLIAPVYRHEGTVARLMGDAILAFFGAPRAHEDDPQRAVMAGLEIVSSVAPLRERLARERGLDLNVRIGINTGPVVVGEVGSELRREYTAMGDAVNVAARMEQTAEPGTVQITEDTYRLVADLFDAEPLGPVELKGKREPVPAYRVRGRLESPWKVRGARSLEAPLVGRTAEMAVLRSAIDDVQRGRGSVVLISSEPGLGKSRLVEEANALWAERYPDDDRRWDSWQCVPYDTMQPYAQYRRQMLERAGIVEADPADVVRAKIARYMTHAVPGWAERSERLWRAFLGVELPDEPRLEGEAFQREANEVLIGSTIAQGGHRLVVFEDMHWCDRASLELVRAPARLVLDHPIVLLITFRPDRDAASWAFQQWIRSELADRTTLLELEPLTAEQSDELIDELLRVEALPDPMRRRIAEKTEGNPLFVQEVARALIDRGVVEQTADGRRLAGDPSVVAIPDSVQSLITAGFDRLPEGARRTLQVAAVIGRSFDEPILAAVAEANGDLGAHLGELEVRDLIRATTRVPRQTFTFRHALTHEAAYRSLLQKQRRVVHRRVAEALEAANAERLEEVAAALVRHFAEAGEDQATLRYAVMAADAATRLYANAEAEAHYRIGLDVARRVGAESSLIRSMYERRGTALELAGRHEDAIGNYEEMRSEARSSGDEAMELAANSSIALLYATPSPLFDAERGRRVSEANAVMANRLGDRASEARALWNVLVSNIYGGGTDAGRAVEAGEASLAIARDLGEREQLAFTLNDLSRAYMSAGDFPAAADRLAEARALWEELENRPMLGDNLAVSSAMRLLAGDHAGAMSEARFGVSIAESIGNRWGESLALMGVYHVQLDRGDLGDGMGSIERCREAGELGGFGYAAVATRADLARVIAYLRNGERALRLAEEALAIARDDFPPAVPIAAVAEADARIALDDLDGARRALDRVIDPPFPEPDRTLLLTYAGLARARVALAIGEAEEAGRAAQGVLRLLAPSRAEILVAEATLIIARARIDLGLHEEAGRALADAVERADRLGEALPLWEALALRAEAFERRGAGSDAADDRRRARAIVGRIAAGIDDADLRASFLAGDEVVALGEPAPNP